VSRRFLIPLVFVLMGPGLLPADVDFNRDVQPILADKCFPCHGPDKKVRQASLRFDTREGAFRIKDGVGPAVILPGRSAESELVRRISAAGPDDRMPPPDSNLELSVEQIDVLKRWIDEGAHWDEHWAFRAPQRPQVPTTRDPDWGHNALDRFILRRLEREGLSPSPEAAKETLIRRATLDLTGLPPTLEEIDAFLADDSPGAYESLVDRLLASPAFGERAVWEWLAAARYADTNGYQGDDERTMFAWRDWVLDALNSNMPFDQFTVEQLAGDLLPEATVNQQLATAFNRNHMINSEGGRIAEENRVEYVFDQTETMSTVWLGLTVGCARCHDHKFDALTQREYYQLFAFFNNTEVTGRGSGGISEPVLDLITPEQTTELTALQGTLEEAAKPVFAIELKLFPRPEGERANASPEALKLPRRVRGNIRRWPRDRKARNLVHVVDHYKSTGQNPEYYQLIADLLEKIRARDALRNAAPRPMIMKEMGEARETTVLVRGLYNKPGERVSAGVPAALTPLSPDASRNRLGLARWLVDPAHPLTARVTVNRYWTLLLGSPLVKTVSDFGVQGEKPSHPELLDWLASEFVAGWDLKLLYRRIVTSAAYRQSSRTTPELSERDPENRLLARGPRYRLPSSVIRDQALAAAGLLTEKVGGVPVYPYQPAGVWEEASLGKKRYLQDHGEKLYRRSLYTFWRRIVAPTMFFDAASRQTCEVDMKRTNTPLHALTTLNDITFVEASRILAERVMQAHPDDETRVETAFRRATARYPRAEEKDILARRLERLRGQYSGDRDGALKLLGVGEFPRDEALDPVEHAAFTGLCSLILNLDEVLSKQ
jgi:hypothetical protein